MNKRFNIWPYVAGVLFVLLAIVYIVTRTLLRQNEADFKQRLRGYSNATLECMAEGNAESFCVNLFE